MAPSNARAVKGWHLPDVAPSLAPSLLAPALAPAPTPIRFPLKVSGPGCHPVPHAPLLKNLLAYWERQRGARVMPARRDIDPAQIPRLLPFVFMVDVASDPLDLSYRLLGTGIVRRSKGDYTGQRLRDLPSQAPPSQIWNLYTAAAIQRSPQALFVPLIGHPHAHVEILAMPLSSDGHDVDILLGGVSFDLVYCPQGDPDEPKPAG